MRDPQATDDEAIAQLRDQERRARWGVYVMALAPLVGCAIAVISGRGTMNAAAWWAVSVAGSALLGGFAWLLWQRPSRAAYGPRIVTRRADEMQRGRSRQLWAYPLIVLCLAPQMIMATRYVLDRGGPRLLGLPPGIATGGYLVFLAISLLTAVFATWMMLTGVGYAKALRSVMDDELSRALRARAIASGFLASLIGGTAVFVAGLIEPRWAVLSLPFVISGSLAVAAAHFALLDRHADASA